LSDEETAGDELSLARRGFGLWSRLRRRFGAVSRRALRGCGCLGLGVAALLCVFLGGFFWALARGPIALNWLAPVIVQSLDELYAGRLEFGLSGVALANAEHGPTLTAEGLTVKSHGRTIVAAPRAELSVDLRRLLTGRVQPRRLQVLNLQLRLALKPNGEVSVSAGADPGDALVIGPPAPAPAPEAVPPAASAAAAHAVRARLLELAGAAARALIDLATNPDSVIGGVDHVGVVHGSLVIEDGAAQRVINYADLTLTLDRDPGGSKFTLAATGAARRWSIVATARGAPGARREFSAEAHDFSLDEVALLSASRNMRFDSDAPLSAHLRFALDPDDLVAEAKGGVAIGAGFFRLDEPEHEPVLIERIDAETQWDRKSRQFILPALRVKTAGADMTLEGVMAPPPSAGGETGAPAEIWTGSLQLSKPAQFGPERPGEAPLRIDRFALRLRLAPAEKRVDLENIVLKGPQIDASGSSTFDWVNGPHVVFESRLDNTELPAVVRLLPTHFGAQPRVWLLEHVPSATIRHAEYRCEFDEADLIAMRYERPPPDAAVRGEGDVVNATLTELLPQFPALKGVSGHVRATGRTLTIDHASGSLDTAHERHVVLTEGSFVIPDYAPKPTPSALELRFAGGVEAITEVLATPALAPYAAMPIDPAQLKGQIDGRTHVEFEVGDGARQDHVTVSLNADASNFSIDRFLGAERLENGALNIVQDRAGLRVSGAARVLGGPASLDIRRAPGEKTQAQAQISVTLDEAARAKMGYALPGVSGLVVASVKTPLPLPETETPIELDLVKTAFDNTLPGLAKAIGKPGKASFTLTKRADGMSLDRFQLETGATQMQGTIELGRDGGFHSAKFSQFRLSPGDDAKLEAARGADAIKINVRGANIDARPFLRTLGTTSVEPRGAAAPSAKGAMSFDDLDVDLKSTLVSGFGKQILSNVDMKWERRGNRPRRFSLTGRFGRESLVAMLERNEKGLPQLEISCADAGALFAFLDLYSRMDSGSVTASVQLTAPGHSDGVLNVQDFYLKNEPAIRQLMTQGAHRWDEKGGVRFDPESVRMQRLQAQFGWAAGRLTLRDGVMSGPEMGLVFDGSMDFANEAIDIGGSYLPFYGLNNLVSNIPLVGPLLSGGAHEGVFGLNYSATGKLDAPTITVSPLSMLTPGLLRKIFGAMDGTARNLYAPAK